MKRLPGDLYASEADVLPFASTLQIRAFLLRRVEGNLLIYSSPDVARDGDAIERLGGVSVRYLNHWHEADFGCEETGARFSAPLVVHAADRDQAAERCDVGKAFDERAIVESDLEAIPTPGHTPGATAYLWESSGHRFLFTGDSLYLSGGEWIAAVLDSSDRASYLESLELIRNLDFDVLVPWAATVDDQPYALADRAEIERRLDAVINRVRNGSNR